MLTELKLINTWSIVLLGELYRHYGLSLEIAHPTVDGDLGYADFRSIEERWRGPPTLKQWLCDQVNFQIAWTSPPRSNPDKASKTLCHIIITLRMLFSFDHKLTSELKISPVWVVCGLGISF